MKNAIYRQRRENLKQLLSERKIPALLVSHAANRFYLSGFELHDAQCNESSGWLVITADGDDYLFTDPRYSDAAAQVWDPKNICVYTGDKFGTVGGFLKDHKVTNLAFEPKAFHLFDHERLIEHVSLTTIDGLVEELRIIKDAEEIRLMDDAMRLNHEMFEHMATFLQPGQTEVEVAREVERFFRENGAEELAFSTIVGVGPNAALPHARPGNEKVRENELVLIDAGCRLHGYNSDQTRTFWIGDKPSDRFKETMELVRGAQQAAIDVIKPGLEYVEAYKVARKVFEDAGVADLFTHGLGHGVGLETHEPPSLSRLAKGILKPGMVVTVEPGLYDIKWGGIRWEYQVLVTEDGCRVM